MLEVTSQTTQTQCVCSCCHVLYKLSTTLYIVCVQLLILAHNSGYAASMCCTVPYYYCLCHLSTHMHELGVC